jgi:hypothetical protein
MTLTSNASPRLRQRPVLPPSPGSRRRRYHGTARASDGGCCVEPAGGGSVGLGDGWWLAPGRGPVAAERFSGGCERRLVAVELEQVVGGGD